MAHGFGYLLLRQLNARPQEVTEHVLVGFAAHSVLVDQGVYYLFDVSSAQAVLRQLHNIFAYLENLIVQVVWDLLAEHHQKIEEEVAEHFVFAHILGPYIDQNKLEEVQHLKRRRSVFAHLLDFLEVREYYLDQVYFDLRSGSTLLYYQLEQAPDLLEEAKHVSRSQSVAKPIDQGLDQLDDAALHDVRRRDLDEALVVIDDESTSLLSALVQDLQLALPVEDVGEPMAPHEKVLFFGLQLGVERCCPLRLRI